MKTAAVIVDDWKVPIFKKHLDNAKYSYEEKPGVTDDTRLLSVKYEWVGELKIVVRAAQAECESVRKSS